MLACHLMKKHDDSCRTGTEPMRHNRERKPTSSGWLCRAEPVKATKNLLNSHLKPDFNRFPHHSPLCTILTIHKATFHWNHSGRSLVCIRAKVLLGSRTALLHLKIQSSKGEYSPFLRSAGLCILLIMTH